MAEEEKVEGQQLSNFASGKPLGKPKRKRTKIIIGEPAKHPAGQIGPREQTIPLRNIGQRGGDPNVRGIIIGPAVRPQTNTGSSIGIVDPRSRRR